MPASGQRRPRSRMAAIAGDRAKAMAIQLQLLPIHKHLYQNVYGLGHNNNNSVVMYNGDAFFGHIVYNEQSLVIGLLLLEKLPGFLDL